MLDRSSGAILVRELGEIERMIRIVFAVLSLLFLQVTATLAGLKTIKSNENDYDLSVCEVLYMTLYIRIFLQEVCISDFFLGRTSNIFSNTFSKSRIFSSIQNASFKLLEFLLSASL